MLEWNGMRFQKRWVWSSIIILALLALVYQQSKSPIVENLLESIKIRSPNLKQATDNKIVNAKTVVEPIPIPIPVPNPTKSGTISVRPQSPIIVLAWNHLHNGVHWDQMNPPLFNKCPPDLNCVVTSDRKRFNESSAVIFHLFHGYGFDKNLIRRPDQYFVFSLWEPPYPHVDFSSCLDAFNLTMTFRRDADVFWPYGGFRKRQTPLKENERNELKSRIENKTKLVSWVVSMCNRRSGRDDYVKELQKFIPVGVYGKCLNTTLTCPHDPTRNPTALATKTKKPCDKILDEYKFYLSLENSVCRDYITEKFFERMDNVVTVPIVFERQLVLKAATDETTLRALNRSFIAADDFENPQKLAEYLTYLDKNMTAYKEYLQWREEYEIALEEELKPGCQLCRVIKEGKKKVIKNIKDWWVNDAGCHKFKQI